MAVKDIALKDIALIDIVLIGGIGVGKTTLAKKLVSAQPQYVHIPSSKYLSRAMALRFKPENVQDKGEFIDLLLGGDETTVQKWETDLKRKNMDDYVKRVTAKYGETFFGEVFYEQSQRVRHYGRPGVIIDNIPSIESLQFLKENGFYAVGIDSDMGTQVKRTLHGNSDIDPRSEPEVIKQIKSTSELFRLPEVLNHADIVYTTSGSKLDGNIMYTRKIKEGMVVNRDIGEVAKEILSFTVFQ